MGAYEPYVATPSGRRTFAPDDSLVVRDPRPDDLDALAQIAAERNDRPLDESRARFERFLVDGERDRVDLLVASSREGVLGYGVCAYLTPPRDAPPNAAPEGWYLGGLVVRREFRRMGVGTALTERRLARIAPVAPVVRYFSNARNRTSIAFHARFGFVEATRDFHVPGVTFDGGVGILFQRGSAGNLTVTPG